MPPKTRSLAPCAGKSDDLFRALLSGNAALARRLLKTKAAAQQAHAMPCGLTTLHAALLGGGRCAGLLARILEAAGGAGLDAVVTDATEVYLLLREIGLEPGFDEDEPFYCMDSGYTPLALAASLCNERAVTQLLQLGASPTAGAGGKTPLLALTTGLQRPPEAAGRIAAALLRHGADCLQYVRGRGPVHVLNRACDEAADACLDHLEELLDEGELRVRGKARLFALLYTAAARARGDLSRYCLSRLQRWLGGARAAGGAGAQPGGECFSPNLILEAAIIGEEPECIVPILLSSKLAFHWGQDSQLQYGSLLAAAAVRCRELLPALHGAGARLTAHAVHACIEFLWPPGLHSLFALGSLPPGYAQQVEAWSPENLSYSCPIHRLLDLMVRGSHKITSDDTLRQPMRLLEALLAAGLRPAVWHDVPPPRFLSIRFRPERMAVLDPFDHYPRSLDSRLVFLAKGGTWSPATHHHWPAAFKAAARTLLLAAHRAGSEMQQGGGGRAGGTCGKSRSAGRRRGRSAGAAAGTPHLVGALSADVLMLIVQQAAMPMSSWLLEG